MFPQKKDEYYYYYRCLPVEVVVVLLPVEVVVVLLVEVFVEHYQFVVVVRDGCWCLWVVAEVALPLSVEEVAGPGAVEYRVRASCPFYLVVVVVVVPAQLGRPV